MLLYSYQKTMLDILKTFGAVRDWQIKSLVLNAFPDHFDRKRARVDVEAQLEQLIRCCRLWRKGDIILLENWEADFELLEAIEVMLQITGGCGIRLYRKSELPAKLTFFRERDGKLIRYDVCFVNGNEDYLAAFYGCSEEYRKIVFVMPEVDTERRLSVAVDHCYAVREDDRGYRFFQ